MDLHQQREKARGVFKLFGQFQVVQVTLSRRQEAVEDKVGNLVEPRWLKIVFWIFFFK